MNGWTGPAASDAVLPGDAGTVAAYRVAVGATQGAVPLPTVARRVGEGACTVARLAPVDPVHAPVHEEPGEPDRGLSWHRVADGYVGYRRCPCGIWSILTASAPHLDAVSATTMVIPSSSTR